MDIDTTIDFNHSDQYTLSVRLDTDGFAFAVTNPLAGREEAACTVTDHPVDAHLPCVPNLRRAFAEHAWLSRPFRRVNVLVATHRYTLMPLSLFEDEAAAEVFYYNFPRRACERVQYNVLHRNNLVVLFGMEGSTCDFLRDHHPGVRFFAQASPLLDGFAVRSGRGNTRKMYVHVRRSHIDVFCYDRGHLLLGNPYACTQGSDRLYNLLYVWTTLGFDQERDELCLCGRVDVAEPWVAQLRQFVRQVQVLPDPVNTDLHMIETCE